jgi:tRNA threonylcarbamoyl adenosine modification protein YeaZ
VLILAVDTASPAGSTAVLDDEKVIGLISTTSDETYSSRLFRQLDFLLSELKLAPGAFDLFAVNSGPGSFTGLRVGLTATKGWAEVYGKPAAPISGLEAVAAQSHTGSIAVPALDARRGQVYFGFYRRDQNELVRMGEDRVASPDEFLSAVREHARQSNIVVTSPDFDALASAFPQLRAAGVACDRVSAVLAPAIGKLALRRARRGEVVDAVALDANYVRRSDAELNWKGPA